MLGDLGGDRAIWIGSEDLPVLVRDPEMDVDDLWAWRFEQECDDQCHHPVHAFGERKPLRHCEWFPPGTTALEPEHRP